MPKSDNIPTARSATVDSAVAIRWDIVHSCRTRIDVAERTTVNLPFGGTIGWHPDSIGHDDLGVAMAYSAADQLDPDGGWDQLARTHLTKAAQHLQQGPPPTLDLPGRRSPIWFVRRYRRHFGTR